MLYVLLALALLVVALLVVASTRPGSFHYIRSIRIEAPAERIVPLIDDFHRWADWSPYEKLDPSLVRTYGGAPRGVGATYAWVGNSKAGVGRMEILEVDPTSLVRIQLDFTKPFEAHNVAEFALSPDDGATRVTWGMRGAAPFMAKLFGIFVDMDNLVGRDFETGLANLKSLAEAEPAGGPTAEASTYESPASSPLPTE